MSLLPLCGLLQPKIIHSGVSTRDMYFPQFQGGYHRSVSSMVRACFPEHSKEGRKVGG